MRASNQSPSSQPQVTDSIRARTLTVVLQRVDGVDERVDDERNVAEPMTNLDEDQEDGDGVAEAAVLHLGQRLRSQLRPHATAQLMRHLEKIRRRRLTVKSYCSTDLVSGFTILSHIEKGQGERKRETLGHRGGGL